ncbi:MAG TPA: 16S rRNA (cytosine(1402)-N(4))-methyltransferase RsmH [Actinomycetota bacterium]|nr:16S rRNA (cytosine(1402)-N(4))-methyltransferase RsmH [Actinomycetota bacterium]
MDSKGEDRGFAHIPVLVDEVVAHIEQALRRPGLVVDCTLGGGGHAEAVLTAFDQAHVLGIDRDQQALEAASRRLEGFGNRFRAARGNFAQMRSLIDEKDLGEVAGVVYDLGVSSPQLDFPERGFGYRSDAPLDMRMDRSGTHPAEDVVNNYSQTELKTIISSYGEERFAGRIASAIVRRRESAPLKSTKDLAEVVRGAIPAATRRTGPHPARRTFQAIRIEVNDELGSLERSLDEAVSMLRPGGRLACISYHSLEDRIVKRRFVAGAKGCVCPPEIPVCACGRGAELRIVTKKPVTPSPEERAANLRSDSAKLRVAEKLEVGSGG